MIDDIARLFPPELFELWFLLVTVLSVLVQIYFGVAVYRSARRFEGKLALVPPFIWGIATFFGGVFVAAAFWAMHHSTLRRPATE